MSKLRLFVFQYVRSNWLYFCRAPSIAPLCLGEYLNNPGCHSRSPYHPGHSHWTLDSGEEIIKLEYLIKTGEETKLF